MNLDQSDGLKARVEAAQMEGQFRQPWMPPAVSQLRAGSAEAIIGSVAFDGPVEMIGS